VSLEEEVAANRQDVRRQASFFREPAREQTAVERLGTIVINVSVSGTVLTRSLGDTLVGGGPTAQQAGPASAGSVAGAFSQQDTLSGEVTNDGLDAFVEAISGQRVGLEQVALGTDDAAPSEADDSLRAGLELTGASGADTGTATVKLRGVIGAFETPTTIGEVGAFDQDGRLLARLTSDSGAVSVPADTEARVTVTFEFAPDTTADEAVTDLGTVSDAPRSDDPAQTLGIDRLSVGTDDTAPNPSDTGLGTRVGTARAVVDRGRRTADVSATFFRPEPSGQPHDIVEVGLRDGSTLVTRQVLPVVEKDDRLRLRFETPIQFRS